MLMSPFPAPSLVPPMCRCLIGAAVACLAVAPTLPGVAQEKSVKPGINDTFQNPDVQDYLGKFEVESREVYLQRHAVRDACRIEPGQTVADIGAGTGLYTRLFSEAVGPGGRVIAVDIARNFLDHIERTAREAKLSNIETVLCLPDSTELPPDSVDVAFICDTYHHFEFPLKTMTSLHKALRPGGRVIVVDFKRVEGESTPWVMNHVRAGQDVFEAEIIQCGFRKVGERTGVLKENYLVEFQKLDTPRPMTSHLVPGVGLVAELTGAPGRPRAGSRTVLDVTAAARPGELNVGLERAARLLNLYGSAGLAPSDARIAVVLHGDAAAGALVDEAYGRLSGGEKNPNARLLMDLRAAGVDVLVCGQTLARKNIPHGDVAEGVVIAASAMTSVINLQADGFALIRVQ